MESTHSLLVVVATYNEIDNLPRLVRQITELLPNADILVIDDASPDGTGNWCETSAEKYPQLATIHRESKLGLGSAAIEGFEYALIRDYEWVATMDADLSHDPESLAEMLELVSEPANLDTGVMIGSRYIEGGGTEGWPWFRQFASKSVNGFARYMLNLKTQDNSGAFRVYRRSALEQLELSQLKSTDFAYLEEILWRLSRKNVQMKEYPILFRNREQGRSKSSPMLGMKVFWQITMMGIGRWK